MKRCPKCQFQLDPVDLKANACPVCNEVLDKRRHQPEGGKVRREDKRQQGPL